jgi:eukaryotic-like serine/threonine-protein kinase
MHRQTPIPEELWNQIPPAAQAAVLGLILQYEMQLRAAHSMVGGSAMAGPPALPGMVGLSPAVVADEGMAALVGKPFSNYTLDQLIAAGNTGAIFRATENTKDGKLVALQVIRPEIIKDEDRERFTKTMMEVRKLRHPTLIRVYGAGKQGPYYWIAMKYVAGDSLASVLQRSGVAGRLDWRRTYAIAVWLARALHEIHSRSVIHRNLKPANVMVRLTDRRCQLGDWSRAKPLNGARVEPLPWPGQLVGDLTYLSPEQTQPGRVEDVRCDIYGMGAILYTLLAGRPPFEAGTVDKMVEKIRGEEPPKPKEFQLAIPEAVQGMVLRCLAKRIDVRFQTAHEVLRECERIAKIHQLAFEPDVE